MNQTYCNNCGKQGHSFHHCKLPIVSYGVIAVRIVNVPDSTTVCEDPRPDLKYAAKCSQEGCIARGEGRFEFLMIRRKDTLGFIDFMRGKYSIYNKEYILNMIKQMTNEEKGKLKREPFSKLWKDLWGEATCDSEVYKSEECNSRNKFELLRGGVYTRSDFYSLEELVDSTPMIWTEPEWGFPKGRRNYQERDCDCAIREFCEETGYSENQLVMLKNIQPFEEIFTGSNYKSYKHKYYVMFIPYEESILERKLQACEVSGSAWMTAEQCERTIRNYNVEKIRVINSVNNMLMQNYLCDSSHIIREGIVANV